MPALKRPASQAFRQCLAQTSQPPKVCTGFTERYAITFGEVAILHVGGKEFGTGMRDKGFSVQELEKIQENLRAHGLATELVDVSEGLPQHGKLREEHRAATLVIRNGASLLLGRHDAADALLEEQRSVTYDRKFWNTRQGKTMNKRARFNVVFGEKAVAASKTYEQPSVISLPSLPRLSAVRSKLATWLGPKAKGLSAEGNHYYDKSSGIGFHGDEERKIVICLSLGKESVLRYQWRKPGSSEPFGKAVDIKVGHGDLYVMSDKAVGYDWKKRSNYRVVHGAGSSAYIDKGYA